MRLINRINDRHQGSLFLLKVITCLGIGFCSLFLYSCSTVKQKRVGSGLVSYQVTLRLQADDLPALSQFSGIMPLSLPPVVHFNSVIAINRPIEVPIIFNSVNKEEINQIRENLSANNWITVLSIRQIGGL